VQVITPLSNLGTAGGIAAGMTAALADRAITHVWVLDDDAVADPGALDEMLYAARNSGAEAVSAMITDAAGQVRWFPGPLSQPAWDVIRSGVTPAEFRARCGVSPLRWSWATWASLLVSRRAIDAVGLPDAQLWYQGTDIEYTLRLSAKFTCVLAPGAVCPHLPPPEDPSRRRTKDLWALQNGAFVAVHRCHGRRLLRHLPGNHFRHWRNHGWTAGALGESLRAFWRGAVRGRPVAIEEYSRPVRPPPAKP
jgi:GT2 family glycosyltransferase